MNNRHSSVLITEADGTVHEAADYKAAIAIARGPTVADGWIKIVDKQGKIFVFEKDGDRIRKINR